MSVQGHTRAVQILAGMAPRATSQEKRIAVCAQKVTKVSFVNVSVAMLCHSTSQICKFRNLYTLELQSAVVARNICVFIVTTGSIVLLFVNFN